MKDEDNCYRSACFWSSDKGDIYGNPTGLCINYEGIYWMIYEKNTPFSVRCLRD